MFQNASSLKPLGHLKPNCTGMIIGRCSTNFCFYADRKSKMAATAGHRLTLDPMRKSTNTFFSETTYMIIAKLFINVHWMVLYILKVFSPIWNSKWRLRQDLVSHWTLKEKCFKTLLLWNHLDNLTKLPRNDHWKVLYKVSVFYANQKWRPPQDIDYHWTLRGNVQMSYSQKLQIRLNPTRQECSLYGPLHSLGFLFRYEMEDGGYSRT